jgi:cytochrome c oxidase subunit II
MVAGSWRTLARPWLLAAALIGVLLIAGCSADSPSTLDPAGAGARRVEGLWWLLFWISVAVFVEVMLLLGWVCPTSSRTWSRCADPTDPEE